MDHGIRVFVAVATHPEGIAGAKGENGDAQLSEAGKELRGGDGTDGEDVCETVAVGERLGKSEEVVAHHHDDCYAGDHLGFLLAVEGLIRRVGRCRGSVLLH